MDLSMITGNPMILTSIIGAVVGFIANKIPFLANHQSTMTNTLLGLVGGAGGGAAATSGMHMEGASAIGTGIVGSLLTTFGGKFLGGNKAE